jgi:hypothetical protein
VVGLGIHPSVCFSQILQSSDEIRSGNGVLALGTKEFRNLVLFHPEVEICGPVGSCGSRCGGNVSLAGGATGVIIVGVDVNMGIVEVVVLWCEVDVVGSSVSGGHFGLCVSFISLIKDASIFLLQILCSDLVSIVGFVVLKALIDVVLEAFEFLCVSFLCE